MQPKSGDSTMEQEPILVVLPDGTAKFYHDADLTATQILREYPNHQLAKTPGGKSHPGAFRDLSHLRPGATYFLCERTTPRRPPSLSPLRHAHDNAPPPDFCPSLPSPPVLVLPSDFQKGANARAEAGGELSNRHRRRPSRSLWLDVACDTIPEILHLETAIQSLEKSAGEETAPAVDGREDVDPEEEAATRGKFRSASAGDADPASPLPRAGGFLPRATSVPSGCSSSTERHLTTCEDVKRLGDLLDRFGLPSDGIIPSGNNTDNRNENENMARQKSCRGHFYAADPGVHERCRDGLCDHLILENEEDAQTPRHKQGPIASISRVLKKAGSAATSKLHWKN